MPIVIIIVVAFGDAEGRVVKRAEATLAPTNIEAPLAAVVPDFFQQVEAKLDVLTRRAVNAQLRERMRLAAGEFVAALATMVGRPWSADRQVWCCVGF